MTKRQGIHSLTWREYSSRTRRRPRGGGRRLQLDQRRAARRQQRRDPAQQRRPGRRRSRCCRRAAAPCPSRRPAAARRSRPRSPRRRARRRSPPPRSRSRPRPPRPRARRARPGGGRRRSRRRGPGRRSGRAAPARPPPACAASGAAAGAAGCRRRRPRAARRAAARRASRAGRARRAPAPSAGSAARCSPHRLRPGQLDRAQGAGEAAAGALGGDRLGVGEAVDVAQRRQLGGAQAELAQAARAGARRSARCSSARRRRRAGRGGGSRSPSSRRPRRAPSTASVPGASSAASESSSSAGVTCGVSIPISSVGPSCAEKAAARRRSRPPPHLGDDLEAGRQPVAGLAVEDEHPLRAGGRRDRAQRVRQRRLGQARPPARGCRGAEPGLRAPRPRCLGDDDQARGHAAMLAATNDESITRIATHLRVLRIRRVCGCSRPPLAAPPMPDLRRDIRDLGDLLGRTLVRQEGEELLEQVERVRLLVRERPRRRRGSCSARPRSGPRAAAWPAPSPPTSTSPTSPSRSTAAATSPATPPPARRLAGRGRWRGSPPPSWPPRTRSSAELAPAAGAPGLHRPPDRGGAPHGARQAARGRRACSTSSSRARGDERAERARAGAGWKRLIDLLWQTDEIRVARPDVVDEARNAVYYLDELPPPARPRRARRARPRAAAGSASSCRSSARPLRFGSWIGGDRDGNPNVSPRPHPSGPRPPARARAARRALAIVDELRGDLSASVRIAPSPPSCEASLAADLERCPSSSRATGA